MPRRKLSENYKYSSPPPRTDELLFQPYQNREPLGSDNMVNKYLSAEFNTKHYADKTLAWELEKEIAQAGAILRGQE